MNKLVLVLVVLAALTVLLVGALAVGCVVYASGHGPSLRTGEQASREETHPIGIARGETLSVDLPAGDVRIQTASEGQPSLAAKITAWGDSREDAEKALARARLDVERTSHGLRVTLADAVTEKDSPGVHLKTTAEADLKVRVPEGVRLEIRTGSGEVDAEGPFAGAKLASAYGDVRVHRVEGDVEASSSSGNVEVESARGKSLSAKSSYGRVRVGGCESSDVDARSSSGDVSLEDVRAEKVRVASAYGDIDLVRVTGDLEARLSSGDVHAESVSGPRLSIATAYGKVRVEKASGALEAKSASGDVRVKGLEGRLEARSSYGSVEAEGTFAALAAETSSGNVVARALPGSRAEAPWRLASAYGDVKLLLPDGFGCDLDARTDYGEVELGLPIELSAGALTSGAKAVRGKLAGGGGPVELRCRSGTVRVEPLPK